MFSRILKRFTSIAALGAHANIRIFLEPDFETAAGELFVINDQRLKHRVSQTGY